MDACIKKIEEEKWRFFKSEAARRNVPMGRFFSIVVEAYKNGSKEGSNWDEILNSKPVLDRRSVDEVKRGIEKLRDEFDFRY